MRHKPDSPKFTVSEPVDHSMNNALTLKDFYFGRGSEDIYSNAEHFAGKTVEDYDPSNTDDVVFRFRSDWDGKDCLELLKSHLNSDRGASTKDIVIGSWSEEMYEKSSSDVISALVEYKDTLQNLKSLYLGDIVSEENEMSWIVQTDMAPILENFPQLEYLRTRGSISLGFNVSQHDNLRALALETGGLDVSVLRSISTATLPALEHLELWLGTEEYGGSCSIEDLQPILSGDVFPKLRYLGIRNYDGIDAACSFIVNSPIVKQLDVLDLSLGTLTDIGARALLNIPTNTSLKTLILNHHFMSNELVEQLNKLPFDVQLRDAQQDDDGWRFVAIGE